MLQQNRLHKIKSGSQDYTSDLDIKYILEIPRCEALITSSHRRTTGKTQLFLVFNKGDRVYSRNGLRGTWDEISRDDEWQVRRLITAAIRDRSIPCYKVNNFKIK